MKRFSLVVLLAGVCLLLSDVYAQTHFRRIGILCLVAGACLLLFRAAFKGARSSP